MRINDKINIYLNILVIKKIVYNKFIQKAFPEKMRFALNALPRQLFPHGRQVFEEQKERINKIETNMNRKKIL